jgi:hypothetical protein
VGVIASQPDDIPIAPPGRLDEEVAVRDPAGQWANRQIRAREVWNPLHRPDEHLAELPAEDGFCVVRHRDGSLA